MYFQALRYKRRNFLKLNNNDYQPICLTYSKSSIWLKHFSLSNLIYVYITRLIIKYTPISEYRLIFFPKKFFVCICGNYSIKTRIHILFDCIWYKSLEIGRENLSRIFLCFQNSILECFVSRIALLRANQSLFLFFFLFLLF